MISRNWKQVLTASLLAFAFAFSALRPASAFLDKTRFVAHVGVAFFAFHHWVMKPYEEGAFASGAPHRTAAIVKGGIALLFAVHEIHVAEKIAQKSKDPLLQKLDAGVANMASTFTDVGEKFKSGSFNPSDVTNLGTLTSAVKSTAASNGVNIKDVPAAIPGV